MAIKKSSGSGIPSGLSAGRPANPGFGQLYANGETARLELFTQASGWQNIVQETPGVSSITGSYIESSNSGTFVVSGTNFVSGAIASVIGTNGVEVQAASTTYNSLVQLTAVFNNLSNTNEPYDVKVTNPSNLFGLIPDALYVNASPVWQTASGSLGTFNEQVSVSISATATDSDSTISYALASGSSLPSGVTLNSSTGVISGTLPNISSNTTYTFTVNATDGLNTIPRTFSITSTAFGPVWSTSGTITPIFNGVAYSYQLASTDDGAITYAINSGSLPAGITLSSSGLISGTTTSIVASTGVLSIVFRATGIGGIFTDQTLSIPTSLYSFSSFTFTTAGVTGHQGPTLTQARSAYSSTSWASNYLNMTTQGIQEWTVPSSGNYYIDAYGAGGGGVSGGTGARIADTFSLTAGEVIRIAVGQYGNGGTSGQAGGGGGGTFVVKSGGNTNAQILVVAGGGGASEGDASGRTIANANTGTSGIDGYNLGTFNTTGGGTGGVNGNGGNSAQNDNCGAGGGGFFTNGQDSPTWGNIGGKAFVNGALGGAPSAVGNYGGFGGGGEGLHQLGGGGAGAGGGYSGGGGGDNAGGSQGGGGGSYYANGLNINRITSTTGTPRNTHGQVVITKL